MWGSCTKHCTQTTFPHEFHFILTPIQLSIYIHVIPSPAMNRSVVNGRDVRL